MPKRGNEDNNMEVITKRLKKLEKRIKKSRRRNRNPSSNSSTSSSTSSSSTSSQSSSSSRHVSPAPVQHNDRDATMHVIEHVGNDRQGPPMTMLVTNNAPSPMAVPSSSTKPPPIMPAPLSTSLPSSGTAPPPLANASTVLAENADDNICPAEWLEILGTDPSLTQEFGVEINQEVANRLKYIATTGLDIDTRKELIDKYLVPDNSRHVAAPQLNVEIKAAVTEQVIKRDKAIELRQKQIAAAISSIGQILSSQISVQEKDNNLLKQLMDTARLLCDIQHSESVTRRNFATYSLKKDLKDQLLTTKIDNYLFGKNLTETLKIAKAVSRSVTDLKETHKKTKNYNLATSSRNLNWRAGPSVRRPQTGPQHIQQQPAALNNQQRGRSSHKSSHRHKQTRRR